MKKSPLPHQSNHFGMRETAQVNTDGTWLEPEAICYPSSGQHRRAYVYLGPNQHNPVNLPYGEMRVVKCGVPDTYFSIPATLRIVTKQGMKPKSVKGYISSLPTVPGDYNSVDRLTFTPNANPAQCQVCNENEGCKKIASNPQRYL